MRDHFLSMSSSKAWASRDHFIFLFFLSPDFRRLWPSVMSISVPEEGGEYKLHENFHYLNILWLYY